MVDTLWWLHQSRYVLQSVIVHHVYLGNIALFFSPCDYCGEASAENGALTKRGPRTGEGFVTVADLELFCPLESFPCFRGSVPEVPHSDVPSSALSRTPHVSRPPCTFLFLRARLDARRRPRVPGQ